MAASAQVFSRAAIAGNPSDGFAGAVCSVIVPFFSATATMVAPGSAESLELVEVTIARFARSVCPVSDVDVSIETTIPRSVGLAGSSAIVLAALRTLDHHVGSGLSAADLMALAHTIERSDLGIAGGWQDQLIQSHGVSGLMEFAGGPRIEPLDLPDVAIPLYLAWSETASEDSGDAHRGLRDQRNASDPVWADLAGHARRAAHAIAERDVHELKDAINTTFDIRRQIMDISPAQLAMVDVARGLGASANFAGSGGAIVGVLPKHSDGFLNKMRNAGYKIDTWSMQ